MPLPTKTKRNKKMARLHYVDGLSIRALCKRYRLKSTETVYDIVRRYKHEFVPVDNPFDRSANSDKMES